MSEFESPDRDAASRKRWIDVALHARPGSGGGHATLQDMPLDLERLSSSELNTLRRLRDTFTKLRLAQAELKLYQHRAPDPDRTAILMALGRAIREPETVRILGAASRARPGATGA